MSCANVLHSQMDGDVCADAFDFWWNAVQKATKASKVLCNLPFFLSGKSLLRDIGFTTGRAMSPFHR